MKLQLMLAATVLMPMAADAQIGQQQLGALRAKPVVKTIHLPPASMERKIEVLRTAGIDVPSGQLDSSVTLSVRDPWIDGNTYLTFTGPLNYSPEHNASTIVGHRDGLARSYVTLNWRSNPDKRHIVDCVVEMLGTRRARHLRLGERQRAELGRGRRQRRPRRDRSSRRRKRRRRADLAQELQFLELRDHAFRLSARSSARMRMARTAALRIVKTSATHGRPNTSGSTAISPATTQ